MGRPKNDEVRPREFLTPTEVERLIKAAFKVGNEGQRNAAMIMVGAAHGLRVSELVKLRWDQVDLEGEVLHIKRLKRGTPTTHPIGGRELRELKRLRRAHQESVYVFVTNRRTAMSRSNFEEIIYRAGIAAGFTFAVHPHMLRHAAGYKHANEGRDTRSIQLFLGHKNIQHTVRYTDLAEGRFKDWMDD